MADKRVRYPVRVVAVKDEGEPAATAETAIGTESMEVVDSVPKVVRPKARRLMERLKRDIAWTAREDLVHEGVSVPGSNVVNLVNDLLRRKRKTVGDPMGWQEFAQQLGDINPTFNRCRRRRRRSRIYVCYQTSIMYSRKY
ncbi:MAG: hypothetical protein M3H12_04765 [Chromatiales bacterium]